MWFWLNTLSHAFRQSHALTPAPLEGTITSLKLSDPGVFFSLSAIAYWAAEKTEGHLKHACC